MSKRGILGPAGATAVTAIILGSLTSGCASAAHPTWTPAAVQHHTVVWSLAGTSDQGGAMFNRPSDRKLKPGPTLVRVSCDIESVLHLALVNGGLERAEQPVPLEPGGKLVCSKHSADHLVELTGRATGGEDRVLVKTRAGATGRDVVTYSIEILQPVQLEGQTADE